MQLMTRQPGHRVSFRFFYLSTLDKTELKRPCRKKIYEDSKETETVKSTVHFFSTKYFVRIQIFLFS